MLIIMNLCRILYLFPILAVLAAPGLHAQDSAKESKQCIALLEQYIELLFTDNFESAGYIWTEEAQERAGRFGITYTGIPLKSDVGSPLVRLMEEIHYDLSRPKFSAVKLTEKDYLVSYSQFVRGKTIKHDYYATKVGNWYRFIYPQDFFGRDWIKDESRFIHVKSHPDVSKYVHKAALKEVDAFVLQMAESLNLSDETLKQIEKEKIQFFYCDTDSTVKILSGAFVKGTLDLSSNDIISAGFPHFHELAHLLINIKLKEFPLYTLPLFREGVAVHFGGRWGKRPATLFDIGAFLYDIELSSLDSILTMDDFGPTASADISYPVAAAFTAFLVDELGVDGYFKLYRKFSGDLTELINLTDEQIGSTIVEELKFEEWSELVEKFEDYLAIRATTNRVSSAGLPDKGKVRVTGDDFTIIENKIWTGFEFRLPDLSSSGSLLFGQDKQLSEVQSSVEQKKTSHERGF